MSAFTQLSVPATELRVADRLLVDYGWAGPPISKVTVTSRVDVETVNGGRRIFLCSDDVYVYRPKDATSAEAWTTSVDVS